MKRTENQEPDYGNWVPAAMMKTLAALTVGLLTAELLFLFFLKNVILSVIGGIFLIATVLFTSYMWRCRVIFDFSSGGLMGEIHQHLIDHLDWNGKGTLLDIGCGAGALTIRCACRFPDAKITGMDYWSTERSGVTQRSNVRGTPVWSMSQTDSHSAKATLPLSNFRTGLSTLLSVILSSMKYAPSRINDKLSVRHCGS